MSVWRNSLVHTWTVRGHWGGRGSSRCGDSAGWGRAPASRRHCVESGRKTANLEGKGEGGSLSRGCLWDRTG